jgi:hypothetical protein
MKAGGLHNLPQAPPTYSADNEQRTRSAILAAFKDVERDIASIDRSGSGGGGDLVDGDYGDVTVSDGGETISINDGAVTAEKISDEAISETKIADGAVTNAKLATMIEATIKGRNSGSGDGEPQDLTIDEVRELLGGAPLPTMQVFSSSATWTKPSGCRFIRVTGVGPGGGGAGGNAPSGQISAGGAGGSGTWATKLIDVSAIASVDVTIGARGLGGVGQNNGTDGGDTSFGSHLILPGGKAGQAQAPGTSVAASNLAGHADPATGADYQIRGATGSRGFRLSGTLASGSQGGSNPWGSGGVPTGIGLGGVSPVGYGAGGGGVLSNGVSRDGAAGGLSFMIVEEFY